jgi:hypothetical protein
MRRPHTKFDSEPALIVTYGTTTRQHWPLGRDLLVLGRGHDCDVPLVSPEIAPIHCLVYRGQTGWSIRDLGSRAGTHVNGERIGNVVLCDGDTLQIGPFCFRAYLPADAVAPVAADDRVLRRLHRSRRNLARLALALRRRLRAGREPALRESLTEELRQRLRACDERAAALAEAERELALDRGILEQEFQALQQRVIQAEQEIARRQAEQEAELQARWRHVQQLCQEAEQAHLRHLQQTPPSAEGRRLDLRRQELAHYAQYLCRTRRRIHEQDAELERRRSELEQLHHQLSSGLEMVQRSDAPHALEKNNLARQGAER